MGVLDFKKLAVKIWILSVLMIKFQKLALCDERQSEANALVAKLQAPAYYYYYYYTYLIIM